jgi:Tetratricopeptide repeat
MLDVCVVSAMLLQSLGPTFADGQPDSSQIVVQRDVEYVAESVARGEGRLLMDVYRPAALAAGGRAPVVIFLNTFGSALRAAPFYVGWGKVAASHGFVAINPEVHDGALERDFEALLAYLAGHAGELRVDPDRIGVYVASGNVDRGLALLEEPRQTMVKAAVVYYGASDIAHFRLDLPLLWVRAGLDRPEVNREIGAAIGAAIAQNAPVTVLNYAGGHHGFDERDDTEATRTVIVQTLTFLSQSMSPAYQAALRARLGEAAAAGALASGDPARAATLYADLVEARPADAVLRLSYGEALLAAGEFRRAREQLDRLKGARLGPYDLGVPAAKACALDGDGDAATAWLRTIPARFRGPELFNDPAFRALRDRPDFKALFQPPPP